MLERRRRWWALAALVPGVLTIGFDLTILNVALPTIARELEAGTDALQWIVNSYVLVFAGLLLPAGVLGDRYGRKRLLLIALALFGVVSVIAAAADEPGVVIAARAVMGLGAAAVLPITLAVLAVLFPEERERGKAIAVIVTAVGVGFPLGPILGGYLLEHFWWGSIFLINVPMAALAMIAITLLLAESRDPAPPRLDVLGGALSTAGLTIFVYAVIEAPERGWDAPVVLGGLAVGVALLAAFVWWELRTPQPLVDLRMFGRSSFLWGTVATAVAGFAIFGLFFTMPQYLQFVAGHDALGTGLRLLPMIGGLVVGAGLGQRLAARIGPRAPVALGLLLIGTGLGAGATTDVTSGYGFVAAWLALAGVGLGASLAVATDAVLGSLPPERAGGGIALTYALRQASGALGVALLGSLVAQTYADHVNASGLPAPAADAARDSIVGALAVAAQLDAPALASSARAAFVDGLALVLIVCAAIAVLGAALTTAFMPGRGVRRDATDRRRLRRTAP